jgi:hypothetical protein
MNIVTARRSALLPVLVTFTALALPACNGDDGGDGDTREVADVPAGAVAVVGDAEITKPQLSARTAAVRRSIAKQPGGSDIEQIQQQALTLLLQQAALEQEAAKQGVTVRPAEVRARLRAARRQFPDKAAFQRFLGRQTVADVLFQLRLQMLGERLTETAVEDGANRKRYGVELMQSWQERTACADGYDAGGCGRSAR